MYNCDDQSGLHIFLCSSNIWSFIYSLVFLIIYGYIINSQCDQLPVGFIAQLVEHCTGIAEIMGSNPVQAGIFSGFNFTTAFKVLCITVMINLQCLTCSTKQRCVEMLRAFDPAELFSPRSHFSSDRLPTVGRTQNRILSYKIQARRKVQFKFF